MYKLVVPTLALLLAHVPAAAAAAPSAGDLVITEIAANPALPEPGGEFVVIDNVGRAPVSLDGVRLTDSARAVRGVVPPDTSLDPDQRIALQPAGGADAYACSPAPHRVLLTAWAALNNDGDTVVLEGPAGTELDRVAYPREAFLDDGPSRRLDPGWRTPAGNDLFARWHASAGPATPCALAPPRPGTLRLAASTVTASERAPSVAVEVRRSGGTNGRVAVPYATHDGRATAGEDYVGSTGTLALAAGQESTTIVVPLIDDARDEADETFTIALGWPSGGAQLGEPARATVVLRDDDEPIPRLPVVVATPVLSPGLPPASAPFAPPAAAPAPPPPGAAPAAPPSRASLGVAAWQQVLRQGGVTAAVGCDRDCSIAVDGRIALGRGRFVRLIRATRGLRAHAPAVVMLRIPARRVRPLRRALRRSGSLRATVTAEPSGGAPIERGARVR